MITLEQKLEEYLKHFGEAYPLVISCGLSDDEVIDAIDLCIETDTIAEEPEYNKDEIY